jgi:poly(A) polymerase
MFDVHPLALELGEHFSAAGYELALVGGSVRDLLLKRDDVDLDFCTNATPDRVQALLSTWVDDLWDVGKDFGTIGGNKNGVQIEVTTYRSDEYDQITRKPLVKYGDNLEADLSRRDFTVNAIALRLPNLELVDPYGGIADLGAKILRTPIAPELSFADDPLRMMRAVRFVSTLGFDVEEQTYLALEQMHSRLEIVSKERIRDEFTKLIMSPNPAPGIEMMSKTGINHYVIPELDDLAMQVDPAHHHKDVWAHSLKVLDNAIALEPKYFDEKNLVVRLAALMHDIGKPATRKFIDRGKVTFRNHDLVGAGITRRRLHTLRFDKKTVQAVAKLVQLHMRFYGYGEQGWTDSAVRRYAHDAGDLLPQLHVLTRSDVTTQNKRKADILAHSYDDIERRITELREKEEFEAIRPDLDGHEIIKLLGLTGQNGNYGKDGKKIGMAYDFLLNYRIENGPQDKESATKLLLDWAKEQQFI